MKVLDELLKETDKKELDKTLKKAFSAIAEPIVVDGREAEALTFLINRTVTGKTDFLDKEGLALLQDENWRKRVLKTAEWIHTHNLKYPYSKADGCICCYEEENQNRQTKILGYAKNSNQINKCQFLVSEFIWQGVMTSLIEQFAFCCEKKGGLIDKLIAFGLPKSCISQFQKKCSDALKIRIPDSVHRHAKQVRFFQDDGEYIAITPVVSSQDQWVAHNLTKESDIYGTTVFHSRPSAIGNFVSATGGRVRCLNYPPRLGNHDHSKDYLVRQWRNKKHLLNESSLYSRQTFNLLFNILGKDKELSTYQTRIVRKGEVNRKVQHLVEDLISNITFIKSRPLSEYPELSKELDGTVEGEVVKGNFDHEQAANHFTRQVHEILERSKYSQTLAYEPLLIEIIANGFKAFFTKNNLEKTSEGCLYIHFERLVAYGANCQGTPYLIGLPSLTAFGGFADAFLSRLGAKKNGSFAIGLRRFARRKGHPLANQIYSNHIVKNDTVIDSQHCDMEFDLIIKLDSKYSEFDLSHRNLFRCLPKRFAGGVLTAPITGTYQRSSLHKQCNLYNDDELIHALVNLPSFTRFISGVDSDMNHDSLYGMSDILKTIPEVLPVNKGFRFLESPSQRDGAIAILHAYARHIFGLVKLRAPTSVAAQVEARENIFWRIQVSPRAVELLSGEPHDRAM